MGFYTQATPGAPDGAQPHWQKQREDWANDQERRHHDEALYRFGENAIFVLLWTERDLKAGLVGRCERCVLAYGKIGETFKQPAERKCPDCFGTTYEGGYRARIVRPALIVDTESTRTSARRGVVYPEQTTAQSTSDFRVEAGDYMIQGDNTRWRIGDLSTTQIHTGFATGDDALLAPGFAFGRVQRVDETDVAYLIPPTALEEVAVINVRGAHLPGAFPDIEDIRGPLIR